MLTITVSQLNRYVKAVLEEQDVLQDLYLKAEISNFRHHTPSGHMYFSLKDEAASVRAIMFRGHAQYLKFMPENGMAVLVRGHVSVYERDGAYQVYVTDLQPDGAGAMAVAVRQLSERLKEEGLFDEAYKKPLPRFPKTIGVITAETGAAIGDITQVLSRRYPLGKMLFYPAIVQGEQAAASLVRGVQALDGRCDVIIIGRGGGSMEDLWAFQDEMLARAIFMAQTPIISAVGHEMDVTICDLVADQRAPTPSAAAELATPSIEQLYEVLQRTENLVSSHAWNTLVRYQQHVDTLEQMPSLRYPTYGIKRKKEQLDFLTKTMYTIMSNQMEKRQQTLAQKAAILERLSPLAVLSRGYTAAFKDSRAVRSIAELAVGDRLLLLLEDGQAITTIDTLEEKDLQHE